MPPEADLLACWKDDIVQSKKLYNERRYRPCAAFCQEGLKSAVHPLHKTFLNFYSAICYESLGTLAHDFSSNKLLFLTQARDAFESAHATLADLSNERAVHTESARTDSSLYEADKAANSTGSLDYTPCPTISHDNTLPTIVSYGSSASACGLPRTITIDFNDYSPRGSLFRPSPVSGSGQYHVLADDDSDEQDSDDRGPPSPTPSGRQKSHCSRLSATLSSKHLLAGELVPSPLFSRRLGMTRTVSGQLPHLQPKHLISSPSAENHCTAGVPPRPQSTPPRTQSRPLPPLPFNHKAKFAKPGNRHILIPSFSEAHPSEQNARPLHSVPLLPPRAISPFAITPMTPRIQQLARIFSPDPENPALDAYLNMKTPRQMPGLHTDSTSLQSFLTDVQDFRKQIASHIAHTTASIEQATRIQSERATRRLDRGVHRLASFWTFETGTPGPGSSNKHCTSGVEAKEERQRRSKENGWRVRKEDHGWKGQEYYEKLRQMAEMELGE